MCSKQETLNHMITLFHTRCLEGIQFEFRPGRWFIVNFCRQYLRLVFSPRLLVKLQILTRHSTYATRMKQKDTIPAVSLGSKHVLQQITTADVIHYVNTLSITHFYRMYFFFQVTEFPNRSERGLDDSGVKMFNQRN